MTVLEYAKRGLVGVLTPQANTTVEPELNILWPPGVSMINARMTSSKDSIVERLQDYLELIDETLDRFANAPIDAVAFGCTGASYLMGHKQEAVLSNRIEKERHYPFITAARAVMDSFEALNAKRIGLVSPYPQALTQTCISYWESANYEVGEVANVFNEESDFHPIYSLPAVSATEGLEKLKHKGLDVIVMLGTGMPTLGPLLEASGLDGPPVTSCMLSLAWRTSLYIDGEYPTEKSMLSWSKGDPWRERMRIHQPPN